MYVDRLADMPMTVTGDAHQWLHVRGVKAAKECSGELPRQRSYFSLGETLVNIKKSHAAGYTGKLDQYRFLSSKDSVFKKREKERCLPEGAESW